MKKPKRTEIQTTNYTPEVEDFSIYEKYINGYVKRFFTPFLKDNIFKVIEFKKYNYRKDRIEIDSPYINKTFYVLAEDLESGERILWDIEDCVFITNEENTSSDVRVANINHTDYRGFNPFESDYYVIDLSRYLRKDSSVFAGSEYGDEVRIKSEIDEIATPIRVLIPHNIASITASFLEAFIKPSLVKLGVTEFNKKISFICTGRYNIEIDLQEAIHRILRNEQYKKYD